MKKFLDYINGHKTWISGVIYYGYRLLLAFEVFTATEAQNESIEMFLGALFGASLTHKVIKAIKSIYAENK